MLRSNQYKLFPVSIGHPHFRHRGVYPLQYCSSIFGSGIYLISSPTVFPLIQQPHMYSDTRFHRDAGFLNLFRQYSVLPKTRNEEIHVILNQALSKDEQIFYFWVERILYLQHLSSAPQKVNLRSTVFSCRGVTTIMM